MGLKQFFSDDVRCDWCGRYMKKVISDTSDALGMGLVSKIAAASHKHYCSTACKMAAKAAAGGENGNTVPSGDASIQTAPKSDGMVKSAMKGFGGMMGGVMNEAVSSVADEMKNQRNEREENKIECQNIIDMDISGTKEEIQDMLGKLATKAAGLTGFFKSPDEKKMLKIIKEKIEFGVMKLNSMGATAEAEFFQKKLDKLK